MILQVRVEPIENAPKDGSEVLVLTGGFPPVQTSWYSDDLGRFMFDPTHYLPDGFPEIPTEAK